jgi:hypothetical protein
MDFSLDSATEVAAPRRLELFRSGDFTAPRRLIFAECVKVSIERREQEKMRLKLCVKYAKINSTIEIIGSIQFL